MMLGVGDSTVSDSEQRCQECAIRSAREFSLFLILPVSNIYKKGNGIKRELPKRKSGRKDVKY